MKRIIVTLAISLILFSCTNENDNTGKKQEKNVLNQSLGEELNYISKDSANKMIQSYLSSLGNDTGNNLQCIILDAKTLRQYLSDTSISRVKVMFAHTLNYINSGHGGQPAGYTPYEFTIVLAGFNSAGNYVLAPGNMVPDRGEPCPDNCTTVGTASSPLIGTN